jgi:hypothetical protein
MYLKFERYFIKLVTPKMDILNAIETPDPDLAFPSAKSLSVSLSL